MTADPKPTVRHIPRQGLATRNADGRSMAGWVTGGALVVALALGFALPARAEADDDRGRGPKVPRSCAITIYGEDRSVTLYPEACLRSAGIEGRLPRACANHATLYGHEDRVYSASCLRSAGFRVARH